VKRALLAVYTDGHFTELARVAQLLARSGTHEPVVCFARSYPQKSRDLAECAAQRWAAIDTAPDPAALEQAPPPAAEGGRGPVRLLRAFLVSLPFPFTLARALARQYQQLRQARRLVATHQPDVVVLAEDGVGYEVATLIKAAHERRVPCVVVPFTVANALEPAEAYYRNPDFDAARGSNRLAAALYPRWVYQHRGRTMVRLPAAQLIAKEWFGLAPPLPWIINSGAADALTVESPFMDAYYRREGLSPERFVRTGALYDDVLADAKGRAAERRAALAAALGLDLSKPMVVCALPPDQFSFSAAQTDFPDYHALVKWWLCTLVAAGPWNVVVRLHPRLNTSDYRYLEQFGIRLCEWDTAALVPLADLYVASVSATIRWAIACGVPVVNYDVYRLRWTDYADAPGVVRVEDRRDFEVVVRRLATDREYFADVRARQAADAARWGNLDGQAGLRMLRLLTSIEVRKRKAENPRKEMRT